MSDPTSREEILAYAIEQEREAQRMYRDAARTVKDAAMREALLEMAEQERGHEQKLRSLDVAAFIASGKSKVPSLSISEYVVAGAFRPDMTYPELLTVAMQKEKAAYRLYTDIARLTSDPTERALFRALAQEEARHKLAFEIEYDENVLREG
jgi:rubrerythrin